MKQEKEQIIIPHGIVKHVKSHIESKLTTGKYSDILLSQLCAFLYFGIVNIHSILDEIEHLETKSNNSRTKKEKAFRSPLLKGLWHKHFFDARFIVKNIGNYWGIDNKKFHNPNSKESKRFENEFIKISQEAKHITDHEKYCEYVSARIASLFVIDAFEHRSKYQKLTGGWIIYAPCDGINHYLTIGFHENNELIKTRIEDYISSIPNLKKKLGW